MLLGVVSDTHGRVGPAAAAAAVLRSAGVEEVVHCGDVGSPAIPPLFSAWPTRYVLGNCDDDPPALQAAVEAAGGTFCGLFGELEQDGVRVAFLHSHEPGRLAAEAASGRWNALLYGHTHQADVRYAGATLLLNPGAIHRASPPQIAVLELPSLAVRHISLR